MGDCDLNNRTFKTVFMKRLNKIQNTSEKKCNELRNKINIQKEHCTEKIKAT